jgi:hypothetical protein
LQTSVHIRTATLSRGLVLVGTCARDPGPMGEALSGPRYFPQGLKV